MFKINKLVLILFAFAGVAILMSSCKGKQRSRTTGWEFNNPEIQEATSFDYVSEIAIDGSWKIIFPPDWDTPEKIVLERLISLSDHADEGIRHFSGSTVYQKSFILSEMNLDNANRISLDLGEVASFGEVILNGKELGIVWKPPYVVDINGTAKSGTNELHIKVTNTWWNRLIGDEKYPEGFPGSDINKPRTYTTHKAWTAEDKLLPSGLLGPVRVEIHNQNPPGE